MHSQSQIRSFANSSFTAFGALISLIGLGVAGDAEHAYGQNSSLSLAKKPATTTNSLKRIPKEKGSKLEKTLVYVGTYTNGKSKGIYLYEMDGKSGALALKSVQNSVNPTFLIIAPDHRHLYAINEIGDFQGTHNGSVSAFSITPESGELLPLNIENSGGNGPCFVAADSKGKNLLVAHYGDGVVTVLPINADGSVAKVSSSNQHTGMSVDKSRQEGPHAHSFYLDPANRFALSADLGTDKVMIYKYDGSKSKITPNIPAFAPLPPGSGPRHMAFHQNGKLLFVINELSSTITGFRYDASKGSMDPIETVSTLPADFKGENTTAEIQIHPNGKFVYGSNRGHDSIAIFKIDATSGKLKLIGHEPAQCKTPRNFRLDPTGHFMIVAGQDSSNLVVFRVDQTTGKLSPAGVNIEAPNPVCIKFLTQ